MQSAQRKTEPISNLRSDSSYWLRQFVLAQPRRRAKAHLIAQVVPQPVAGETCLDIGTNHGGMTSYYVGQGDWTFLDPLKAALDVAKTFLTGTFTNSPAEEYLREHRGFQRIYIIDTFFYFKDPHALLALVHDSLAPNGMLVISGIDRPAHDPILWLRHLTGIERAIGVVEDGDKVRVLNWLTSLGFAVEQSHSYFGPLSQIIQSVIDYFNIQEGDEGAGENRLSFNPMIQTVSLPKKVVTAMLQPVAYLANVIDRAFLPFRTYAFLITAKKK